MNIHFPLKIQKTDPSSRTVTGIATGSRVDSSGELLTYEGSKAAFQEWDTKNVREMHSSQLAVGKAVAIEFDDSDELIRVSARISRGAESTWLKVLDGTLGYYSVAGRRIQSVLKFANELPERVWRAFRGQRPEKVRVTSAWQLTELSLVDSPALPITRVELVKSVGGIPVATPVLAGGEFDYEDFVKRVGETLRTSLQEINAQLSGGLAKASANLQDISHRITRLEQQEEETVKAATSLHVFDKSGRSTVFRFDFGQGELAKSAQATEPGELDALIRKAESLAESLPTWDKRRDEVVAQVFRLRGLRVKRS